MASGCRVALLALLACSSVFSAAYADVYSYASQYASDFNVQLTGASGTSGQCLVQDGPTTVAGPFESLVQNDITGSLSFLLPGAAVLGLVRASQNNSYLSIAQDGRGSVTGIKYHANGSASGTIQIDMELRNDTGVICSYTVTVRPQETAQPLYALGLYNGDDSKIDFKPVSPGGFSFFNPDRECLVANSTNGTVEGPFTVFVPYGQVVNLTAAADAVLYATSTDVPSVNVSSNGGVFSNAIFTSYGNGLATKLQLGLDQPTVCTSTIYFVPFAGPTLGTPVGSLPSPPPPVQAAAPVSYVASPPPPPVDYQTPAAPAQSPGVPVAEPPVDVAAPAPAPLGVLPAPAAAPLADQVAALLAAAAGRKLL